MKNFTYYQPKSVEAAVGLLGDSWGRAELLGGGTSLMDMMKEHIAAPDKVISLSGIPGQELNNITRDDNAQVIAIGGSVKIATIADNAVLRQLYPGLTDAASTLGGPQIR